MKEIKTLGYYQKEGVSRSYTYSLFECPICGRQVEKIRKDGINASHCSHECYAKNRKARGAYNDYVTISGYKYIYDPRHPFATHHGYVAEHRLVMEKVLGRYLKDNEDVHHLDFNKLNNDPGNLLILTSSQHSKLHYYFNKRFKGGLYAKNI